MDIVSSRTPYFLILGFVSAAIFGTLSLVFWTVYMSPLLTIKPPISLNTYAQLLSAFGTIVLTLSLVLLYGEQTDIQRRQEEWMEAEHVPDVFVESWSIDGETFEFEVTNLGTGIAKNLEVYYEFNIISDGGSTSLSKITGVAPLEQQTIYTRVLPQDSDTDGQSITMAGAHDVRLQYENLTEEYICRDGGRGSYSTLRGVLQTLSQNKYKIEYTIFIRYDFIRRESSQKSVYGGLADIQRDIDFEGILLTTADPKETQLNIEPDNLEEN